MDRTHPALAAEQWKKWNGHRVGGRRKGHAQYRWARVPSESCLEWGGRTFPLLRAPTGVFAKENLNNRDRLPPHHH